MLIRLIAVLILSLVVSISFAIQSEDKGSDAAREELIVIEQQISKLKSKLERPTEQKVGGIKLKLKELQLKKEQAQSKLDMYIKLEEGAITYLNDNNKNN